MYLPHFLKTNTHIHRFEGDRQNINSALSFSERLKQFVFVIVEEYHNAYMLPPETSTPLMTNLYQLSLSSRTPLRHVCIVSGSSPYLRNLCFGKFNSTSEITDKFPSYRGKSFNLNSQRFKIVYLPPFPFELFNESYRHELKGISEADREALFALTGGVHRYVDHVLASPSRNHESFIDSRSLAHLGNYSELWRSMFLRLEKMHEDSHSAYGLFQHPANLLRPIDQVVDRDGKPFSTEFLHQAADEQAIIFQQSSTSDAVSFIAPLHVFIIADRLRHHSCSNDPAWFSPLVRIWLHFPYGPSGIKAEQSLAQGPVHICAERSQDCSEY